MEQDLGFRLLASADVSDRTLEGEHFAVRPTQCLGHSPDPNVGVVVSLHAQFERNRVVAIGAVGQNVFDRARTLEEGGKRQPEEACQIGKPEEVDQELVGFGEDPFDRNPADPHGNAFVQRPEALLLEVRDALRLPGFDRIADGAGDIFEGQVVLHEVVRRSCPQREPVERLIIETGEENQRTAR